ncbi:MAG: hypothetical protein MUF58_14870 [Arcicella sp.]|jgi:nucleoside 2-deoxyribosyltransferase|nr:hypothetical protein [Arcicella sp.]
MLKITISGHRKLLNESEVRNNIALSLQYFQTIDKDLQAISALAVGADTIFAEEAKKLKIPVRYVLPFELEEYEKDFSPSELKVFRDLLAKNQQPYEVVSPLKDTQPETKNEAYMAVGKRLVDECDILVAVWDGQDAQGLGGTGDVVAYAHTVGKPVHIVKAVREGSEILQNEVDAAFETLDKEAIKFKQERFIPAWGIGIFISMLAVICFAVSVNFKASLTHEEMFILALLEVIFLGISSVLLLFFARRWKQKFLVNRRDAEYLRTLNWYKDAQIPIPTIARPTYKISDNIRAIEQDIKASIGQLGDFANAKRIAWSFAKEQANYHQGTRIEKYKDDLHKTEKALNAIKILFIFCIAIKFFVELATLILHWQTDHFLSYLNTALIILPALFAALEGILFFSEWERNITISESKVKKLENSCHDILNANDETTLLKETAELRHILEIENSDWAKRYEKKIVDFKFF